MLGIWPTGNDSANPRTHVNTRDLNTHTHCMSSCLLNDSGQVVMHAKHSEKLELCYAAPNKHTQQRHHPCFSFSF